MIFGTLHLRTCMGGIDKIIPDLRSRMLGMSLCVYSEENWLFRIFVMSRASEELKQAFVRGTTPE